MKLSLLLAGALVASNPHGATQLLWPAKPKALVAVAPTPPAVTRAFVAPRVVNLAWDASPSPVAGYRLYEWPAGGGVTNQTDVGDALAGSVALMPGLIVVGAKAYDGSGLESDFSNLINYNLAPVPKSYRLSLKWQTNGAAGWSDVSSNAFLTFTNGTAGGPAYWRLLLGRTATNDNLMVQTSGVPSGAWSAPRFIYTLQGTNYQHRLGWRKDLL